MAITHNSYPKVDNARYCFSLIAPIVILAIEIVSTEVATYSPKLHFQSHNGAYCLVQLVCEARMQHNSLL